MDLTTLLGKLQQHGLVKIIFDPSIDEEPLVQLTEKGRQELTELLFSNEPNKESQLKVNKDDEKTIYIIPSRCSKDCW